MMAVLTAVSLFPVSVEAEYFTYWAYIPNPPLLTPVTWNDDPPLIYINDSSWFPGPEDQRGPEFPNEEGREFNLSGPTALGFLYPPLCIGPVSPCIPLSDQVWVTPKGEGNETFKNLFMLSGKGFKTVGFNTHLYPPPVSPCLQDRCTVHDSRIHWEECRGEIDRVALRFQSHHSRLGTFWNCHERLFYKVLF